MQFILEQIDRPPPDQWALYVETEPDDPVRHWSPYSEKYTTGDALLNALENGWVIDGIIFRQDFWRAGVRRIPVYHFTLRRGNNLVKMKVVDNPWVNRLVSTQCSAQVVLLNQRKDNGDERWHLPAR
ncbi:MAG: hypothetical protein HZC41_25940 [Chloroflexi bacterium]|nr:hypothetical protein [Chloroflexota bacterium]